MKILRQIFLMTLLTAGLALTASAQRPQPDERKKPPKENAEIKPEESKKPRNNENNNNNNQNEKNKNKKPQLFFNVRQT